MNVFIMAILGQKWYSSVHRGL